MSKTEIPTNDSLKTLQRYVWQMNIDRGFNTDNASHKLVMLMEEMGELAKSMSFMLTRPSNTI